MKKAIPILIFCIVLASCKSDPKTDHSNYIISGITPGVPNGVRAYLKSVNNQRQEIVKDSAIIVNEKFAFNGEVDEPQLWYLTINSINGSFMLIIENENISIRANADDLTKSTISGSSANDALTSYTSGLQKLSDKRHALTTKNIELQKTEDATEKAKMAVDIKKTNQELTDYPFVFLSQHADNYFSLILLESLLGAPNMDFDKLGNLFNTLSSNIKSSDYGQRVSSSLDLKKLQIAKLDILNIGQKAPNFSAPNPDGNMIALNDIKGKVTIIDFWASWCGPCRKENPNVVKVYKKYHDKGLEIINVSLDRPGQKDKWLKAIADDKLTWHHVSNLEYFNDPIAKLYHINSIPSTYILDKNGIIVAKNLRGATLDAKIAELLD